MDSIIFVSFYTLNTIYEENLNTYLLPSLVKYKLDYWIKPIESNGSWASNALLKPDIILEAMRKFDSNIVWIDVDARINQYPSTLIEMNDTYDIGVHYLNWEEHYGRPKDKGKKELIDGTIWINNSNKMKNFVKNWKSKSTDIGVNHQKPLEHLLAKNNKIKIFDFGREYCYITSKTDGSLPAVPINMPVISHYQTSRKARKSLQ